MDKYLFVNILDLLEKGNCSISDLSRNLNKNWRTIKKFVDVLVFLELVKRINRCKYGLVNNNKNIFGILNSIQYVIHEEVNVKQNNSDVFRALNKVYSHIEIIKKELKGDKE